jgi:hypothetical protein
MLVSMGAQLLEKKMKTIIVEELRGGRTVGLLRESEMGGGRTIVEAGTIHNCRMIPLSMVCHITRSGHHYPPEDEELSTRSVVPPSVSALGAPAASKVPVSLIAPPYHCGHTA